MKDRNVEDVNGNTSVLPHFTKHVSVKRLRQGEFLLNK